MSESNMLGKSIGRRQFAFVGFLFLNALTWWYMTNLLVSESLRSIQATDIQTLTVQGMFLGTTILFCLLGALLGSRVKRSVIVLVWIVAGASATLVSAFVLRNLLSLDFLNVVAFSYGASFGIGLPACLSYFARSTSFENRGHRGGIVLFVTFLLVPFLTFSFGSDLWVDALLSGLWRVIGLLVFAIKPKEEVFAEKGGEDMSDSTLRNRSFLLYLIPWFMFCLIDRFEASVLENAMDQGLRDFAEIVAPVAGIVFALVGGFLCDWVGRKKVIVSGFIALGLAYAALGLLPSSPYSITFYILVDGVAAGIFTLRFVLVIWGDLASSRPRMLEKYYALGVTPYFIANLMHYVASIFVGVVPKEASFSLASLFLFVAVLPLMYAPETLPEKKIKEREMKDYIEKAKKAREKSG